MTCHWQISSPNHNGGFFSPRPGNFSPRTSATPPVCNYCTCFSVVRVQMHAENFVGAGTVHAGFARDHWRAHKSTWRARDEKKKGEKEKNSKGGQKGKTVYTTTAHSTDIGVDGRDARVLGVERESIWICTRARAHKILYDNMLINGTAMQMLRRPKKIDGL